MKTLKAIAESIKSLMWDIYYLFTEGFYVLCEKLGFWNSIGLLIGLTLGVIIACNIL